MDPVIIHADGTDCHHKGQPQASAHDDGALRCPAGIRVTHVRFNGQMVTIEEACATLKSAADAWVKAITPVVAALAGFVRQFTSDPAICALAAAAAVVDEERALDDARRGPLGWELRTRELREKGFTQEAAARDRYRDRQHARRLAAEEVSDERSATHP